MLQGLTLSITGLMITFLVLGLFILVMIQLQRLFPVKNVEETADEEPPTIIQTGKDDNEAVVAAIMAVNYLSTYTTTRLGEKLQSGHSSWWEPSLR